MRRYLTVCMLLLILPSVQAAEALDVRYLQGLGDTRYRLLESEQTGRSYHLYISLPAGHDTADHDYPTIYLLDGGGLFPMLAGYHRYLRFGEEVPEAIVVGISYGADSFEGGNYRSTDYTAPSDERDYWGGAASFQAFLAEDLMPSIEAEFKSDAHQRIIFGHSLGGQFVLYTAQTRPELFRGHLASNPALHRNLPFFLETRSASGGAAATRLFIGAGEYDGEQFRVPREAWLEHWTSMADTPWQLQTRSYAGHGHMSTPPAVFRDGLRWLFADAQP